MSEEKEDVEKRLDLTSLELEQILGLFVGILSAKAWQYMGYRLQPGKEEAEKDLAKASASIDCVAFLIEKLSTFLPSAEADRMRAMVTDLQINFAKTA